MKNKIFFIAEISANHCGNFKLAKKLIISAKKCGADAVKFQTWITEDLCTAGAIQADYQAKNTGRNKVASARKPKTTTKSAA